MRLSFTLDKTDACILVMGMFDGVHMGHTALIEKAKEIKARHGLPIVVCTFDKHPLSILNPASAPPMLTTVSERARAMAKLKVDTLMVLPFTRDMANMEPEAFLRVMTEALSPKHIVVGFNYFFGKGGKGNDQFLIGAQEAGGFEAHIVPPVVYEGETVSSSRIRQLLTIGEMMKANMLLTHAYGITGTVLQGKRIGRTLGFPTANLALPEGKAIPRFGVYTALLCDGDKIYPAVLNIGKHPTLPEGRATVEAHVLSGNVSLYGKKVRVSFLAFQRPEMKFSDADALKKQIRQDTLEAQMFFDRLMADGDA